MLTLQAQSYLQTLIFHFNVHIPFCLHSLKGTDAADTKVKRHCVKPSLCWRQQTALIVRCYD